MLAAQAGTELRLALRNGEQVLLTLLIPVVLLVGLTLVDVVAAARAAGRRGHAVGARARGDVDGVHQPGHRAGLRPPLRRDPAARRDGAAALAARRGPAGRGARTVVACRWSCSCALAAALGWRPPAAGLGWAVLLVLLGCAAFGALGILLGGTLRAEVVLAVANAVWFVLLLAGGIVVPLDRLPGPVAAVAALLPSGALAEGLRTALTTGAAPGAGPVLVLLGLDRGRHALSRSRTVRLR